eukprot:g9057.t1
MVLGSGFVYQTSLSSPSNVRLPKGKTFLPVASSLYYRYHRASPAGISSSHTPLGFTYSRGLFRGTEKLEESISSEETTSFFRTNRPLLDSVDELDNEVGLKASTKSRAVYEVLRLDNEGRSRRIYVKRRDLLRAHGLKPRDLRRIDPAWEKPQSAHSIVIKDSAFLVSLLGVRCLVTEERLLLFDPESPTAKKFVKFVTPRLRTAVGSNMIKSLRLQNGRTDADSSVDSNDSQQETPLAPFELEVLEGILTVASSQLDADLLNLMKEASEVLSAVPSEVNPLDLEQLRKTKQACVELESRAEAIREMLEEILDDEDELIKLNLSSRPQRENRIRNRERSRLKREQNESNGTTQYQNAEDALADLEDEEEEEREVEEVEDMLEYYMQRSATVESEAERVLAGARDLEESISVSLSARRFEVNRLELMLSMGSFAAAIGAMFAGIFGMNLRSNLEMSLLGFYGITGLIVVGCFYVFFSLFLYTKKKKKAILDDLELTELWNEMMEVVKSDNPAKDSEDMVAFVTKLFGKLSRKQKNAFVSKKDVEEVFKDLPPMVVQSFKELGLWDRLPNAGFTAESIQNLHLWTEEEAQVITNFRHFILSLIKVFGEDPNVPPPLDEEEEIRKEETLIRAVHKLEDFFSSYPDDPAEVLNIMVASKLAMDADENPLNNLNNQLDDVDEDDEEDFSDFINIKEIESCLQVLEEGEDAPHPDPTKETVLPAEPAEVFKKRMKLMQDFYLDPERKPRDRKLSPEEYKALKQRWDEFMPDEEPLYFQDIDHVRLAPEWPDWMERHFRALQHIFYILRAAHVNAKLSEPGKRLMKYDRIDLGVTYRDPAVELNGLEQYSAHMKKMEDLGFTTEPSLLFCDCQPPKDGSPDHPEIENPWNYTIIVDQHFNIPIPEWYHAELDAVEAQMTEEDLKQSPDEFLDQHRFDLMDSVDKIFKKKNKKSETKQKTEVKAKEQKCKEQDPEMESRLDALNVGIKDGQPKLYEPFYLKEDPKPPLLDQQEDSSQSTGDYWYEGPRCEAWKEGYMITVNTSVLYKLDIVEGKVSTVLE